MWVAQHGSVVVRPMCNIGREDEASVNVDGHVSEPTRLHATVDMKYPRWEVKRVSGFQRTQCVVQSGRIVLRCLWVIGDTTVGQGEVTH